MQTILELVESSQDFVESMKTNNEEYERNHNVEPLPPHQYEILEIKLIRQALEVRLRLLEAIK